MVILAVLVAIVIAAMIAGGTLMTAGSGAAFAKASDRSAQLRSLAFSGVLAATSELSAQRLDLLAGAAPRLTGEWELFRVGDIRGTVRLLPVEISGSGAGIPTTPGVEAPLALSEAACLNVDTADEAMIAAVTTADVASSLVQQRVKRLWTDRSELVEFLSRQPASPASTSALTARQPPGGSAPSERAASINSAPVVEPPAGMGFLTAASFEPQTSIRAAEGGAGEEVRQADVSKPMSEGTAASLTETLGADLFAKLKKAIGSKPVARRSELVAALRTATVPPADWELVLDAVCFDDRPFAVGRIDMNRAPTEVLASVPGLGAEAAAAIVRTRDRLDDQKRRSLTWPLTEQVLTPDQFQAASDWLTTRSMVWTVRVEAVISRDEPKATLSRTVWTVVIDVADPTPRIVSIRDQMLQDGVELSLADFPSAEGESEESPEPSDPIPNNPLLETPSPIEDDAQPETAAFGGQDALEPTDLRPAAAEPVVGKDNRIGRWTTGGGR